jgi:hypothetical protein
MRRNTLTPSNPLSGPTGHASVAPRQGKRWGSALRPAVEGKSQRDMLQVTTVRDPVAPSEESDSEAWGILFEMWVSEGRSSTADRLPPAVGPHDQPDRAAGPRDRRQPGKGEEEIGINQVGAADA